LCFVNRMRLRAWALLSASTDPGCFPQLDADEQEEDEPSDAEFQVSWD
jgi:hypothetical protein